MEKRLKPDKFGSSISKSFVLRLSGRKIKRGKFARVAVCIDLTQPVKDRIEVNDVVFRLEYENLYAVCLNCGMLGHVKVRCPKKESTKENSQERAKARPRESMALVDEGDKVGPWVRAKSTWRNANKGKKKMDKGAADNTQQDKSSGSRFDSLIEEDDVQEDEVFGAEPSHRYMNQVVPDQQNMEQTAEELSHEAKNDEQDLMMNDVDQTDSDEYKHKAPGRYVQDPAPKTVGPTVHNKSHGSKSKSSSKMKTVKSQKGGPKADVDAAIIAGTGKPSFDKPTGRQQNTKIRKTREVQVGVTSPNIKHVFKDAPDKEDFQIGSASELVKAQPRVRKKLEMSEMDPVQLRETFSICQDTGQEEPLQPMQFSATRSVLNDQVGAGASSSNVCMEDAVVDQTLVDINSDVIGGSELSPNTAQFASET